jgi:eukaryotic-like serine/threonine-protein kinase
MNDPSQNKPSRPAEDGVPGLARESDPGATVPLTQRQAAGRGASPPQGVNSGGASTVAAIADGGSSRIGAPGGGDDLEREAAKAGTNVDTFVGKLVVDQGLATPEEVEHCIQQSKMMAEEKNQRSLLDLLVNNEYVTRRQMSRLREQVAAERSGQKIPGFKIINKLGAGAMATVYKAKQLSLDRLVAIKVLPRKFTSNTQFIERFYAEGRAAAQLNHPNIVQAYDVGKAGELYYFVMEFVDGTTVYDEITKKKRYGEAEAVDIAIQMAEALEHAHGRGIIHRDVKPKNIMMASGGGAKLADMGLARAVSDKEAADAEQGKAFGTPYYISPEQIRGELTIGPPADIYSLGATMYHMLTGSVPFDGKNPSAVMHKHLKADLVPPDHVNPKLSAGISEVIEMMMAKNPKDRYQTCRDLIVDLRAVKEMKSPPIAHKDFGQVDLSSLAKAEAATPTEIAVDASAAKQSRPLPLWQIVAFGVSLLGNVILIIVLTVRG